MVQVLIVWTNTPDATLARSLAQMLTEQRLAACVNILPAIQSTYRWRGTIEHAEEHTLVIKTTRARYDQLEAAIAQAHPHDVPEIVALPIECGLPAYLNWVIAETGER